MAAAPAGGGCGMGWNPAAAVPKPGCGRPPTPGSIPLNIAGSVIPGIGILGMPPAGPPGTRAAGLCHAATGC